MSDLEQYAADAQATGGPAGTDLLAQITDCVNELRDVDKELSEAEAALKDVQSRRQALVEVRLPTLMKEARQSALKTEDGHTVAVTEELKCSIPKAREVEAMKWLAEHGQQDIIKRELGLKFGRAEGDKADEIKRMLEEAGYLPNDRESVHYQTLRATLNEMVREGVEVPMDLFGGYIQTVAKVKFKT